jgi:hypothetical protein
LKKTYILAAFFAVFAFISTAAFFYPSLSTDAWWHISSGREIAKAGGIPAKDDFYCAGSSAWYAHEWLFDLAAYKIFFAAGERGFRAASAAVLFAVLLLLMLASLYRSAGGYLRPGAAALLAAALLLPFAEERPQLITMLMLSLFLLVSTLKPGGKNLIAYYLLVPASLLWANMHSTVPVGMYILLLSFLYHGYSAGEREKKDIILHSSIILSAIFLASVASPLGLRGFMFFGEDPWIKAYIMEWQGIWSGRGAAYFAYIAVFIAAGSACVVPAALGLANKKTRPDALRDILLILPFFIAAILIKKAMPVFAVICVPVMAARLYVIFKKDAAIYALAAVLLSCSAAMIAGKIILPYPEAAAAFVKAQPGQNCVLTSYEWGGYLEYELYPGKKVFLNGRLNAPAPVIEEYSEMYHAVGNFPVYLGKYHGYFILPYTAPLAVYFRVNHKKALYEDRISLVYGSD